MYATSERTTMQTQPNQITDKIDESTSRKLHPRFDIGRKEEEDKLGEILQAVETWIDILQVLRESERRQAIRHHLHARKAGRGAGPGGGLRLHRRTPPLE